MNYKYEVDKDNPFELDLFNRKDQVIKLHNLIEKTNNGFVACIDAPFGVGKTTFFKMFEAHLNTSSEDVLSVYFDAWENDFFNDPLVAMVSCLKDAIAKKNDIKSEDLEKIGASIGANLSKKVSFGIIDINQMHEKMKKDSKRSIISEFEDGKKNREGIRDELRKIATKNNLFKQSKVVFFIDELDRCKPSFALNFIEVIKHFFDIENYFFIMAMDKSQLGSTIKKVYGDKIDSEGYLRRFIDFDITLNPIEIDIYIHHKFDIIKGDLFKTIRDNPTEDMRLYFIPILCTCARNLSMSLRDVDKIFYLLNLMKPIDSLRLSAKSNYNVKLFQIECMVLGMLIAIKVINPSTYNNFIRDSIDQNDLYYIEKILKQSDLEQSWFKESASEVTKLFSILEEYITVNKSDLLYENLNKEIFGTMKYYELFDASSSKLKFKAVRLLQLLDSIDIK